MRSGSRKVMGRRATLPTHRDDFRPTFPSQFHSFHQHIVSCSTFASENSEHPKGDLRGKMSAEVRKVREGTQRMKGICMSRLTPGEAPLRPIP